MRKSLEEIALRKINGMEKFIDDEDKSFSQIFDLGFLPPFFLRLRNIPFESQSLQQIDCDEKKEKKKEEKKMFHSNPIENHKTHFPRQRRRKI